jgi:hypothetical protein
MGCEGKIAESVRRRLFARQAEVFAGFLEHADHEIGRFKKALEDIGALDNTLFIPISSRRTRRLTSASTIRHRSPKVSASARRLDLPARSTRSPLK